MKFLIKSNNLEKLHSIFQETSSIIKKAISEKRPIIIRHHDDVDGYTAGLILERAIEPLIKDNKTHYYLTRSPCRSPYYNYIDALHDLSNYLSSYNNKAPLIILTDLGSNEQSIKAIKRLHNYNIDFIILDHHRYDNANKEMALKFLNPHAYGLDSNLNAGILAVELSRFLNPLLTGVKHLPALSAIADKSSGKDVDAYVKVSGFSEKELEKWSVVIDHELYYLRFPAKNKFFDDLFFPSKRNLIMINLMYKNIQKEFNKIKIAAKKYVKITNYNKFKLLRINRDVGFYDYASSKLARIVTDLESGPRITFVETPDSISYRADKINFKGVDLINELKQKFPHALINGGGHDAAGSIQFNIASKEELISYILQYLKKI